MEREMSAHDRVESLSEVAVDYRAAQAAVDACIATLDDSVAAKRSAEQSLREAKHHLGQTQQRLCAAAQKRTLDEFFQREATAWHHPTP
jgi:hypothetical protein